jgi:hypothetical protein
MAAKLVKVRKLTCVEVCWGIAISCLAIDFDVVSRLPDAGFYGLCRTFTIGNL